MKKKILIILSSIVMIVSLCSTVYAYFITQVNSNTHTVTVTPDDSNVIDVETKLKRKIKKKVVSKLHLLKF